MLPSALGGLRFRVPPVPGRCAPGSMEKIKPEQAVMMQLYKMASKSGLKYGNDNFQESDAEILIGATSRAASTEVAKGFSTMT